jgi:lipoate-protein ligase A
MLTRKQWQEFLQDVRRYSFKYDLWIHGAKVVDVANSEVVAVNEVEKKKIRYKFPDSFREKNPSLRDLYHMVKVKTKPENLINTTLGRAKQTVKVV